MALSDEQRALRDSVRQLLSRECDSAAVRRAAGSADGFDRTLWSRLCTGIGVAGLVVPETYGGLGAGGGELHVVLAELGRALCPGPLLGSAVVAAQAILAAGDADACRTLLPGIAAGTTIAALAWAGPDGRWGPGAAAFASTVDNELTGTAHYVLDAAGADVLIAVAHTADGTALFQVDPAQPSVERAAVPTMDITRRLGTVRLTGAHARRLGPATGLARVRDLAWVALAAEQAGAARACLEQTVAYSKDRVQFGRPIGSFQALKHRMADMYVLVETAESAALAAAAATGPELPLAAAVAREHCSEALCTVAAEMTQLHGGIAITWEHDAHLYLKRAHAAARLFGRADPRAVLSYARSAATPATSLSTSDSLV
ncbi:MAG TPA: acyl-CoA dehydrogenase family protein [Actinophytocola sp.]|nr:acyl-CoA dehydrogenase family protein [Actinophytocola sp.]HET9138597.1 acyl-CoA dehydrogenase family protein [Actinophytocola sp.]